MPDRGSVAVEAWLCVWRIFGVGRDFSDKQLPWSTSANVGPNAEDALSVTIGEIPTHILDALRTHRGQIPYILNRFFGQQYAGMSIEEQVAVLERYTAEVDLGDVTGGFPLFVTFELSRPIQIQADPAARFFWAPEGGPDVQTFEEFSQVATEHLATAVACVQAELGDQLRLDRLVFRDDRAYLVATGKAAITVPRATAAASGIVLSSGWSKLPFNEVKKAVETLPAAVTAVGPVIVTPSRWLQAALAEREDLLRRFLFAFFGLEVLVNKVERAWKLRDEVGAELSKELGGAPIDVLMWPVSRDDEAPFRNLMFRFACLAILLSRSTAIQDVAEFRQLVRTRNALAHGEPTSIDSLPAWPCIEFLRRYLSLVARAATARRGR